MLWCAPCLKDVIKICSVDPFVGTYSFRVVNVNFFAFIFLIILTEHSFFISTIIKKKFKCPLITLKEVFEIYIICMIIIYNNIKI